MRLHVRYELEHAKDETWNVYIYYMDVVSLIHTLIVGVNCDVNMKQ